MGVQLESPVPQDLQLQGSGSSIGREKEPPPLCLPQLTGLSESRVHTWAAEVLGVDLSFAQESGSEVLGPVSFFCKLKSLISTKPQMNGSVHLAHAS